MEKLARDVDTAQEPPEALFVLVWGLKQRGADAAALASLPCPGSMPGGLLDQL